MSTKHVLSSTLILSLLLQMAPAFAEETVVTAEDREEAALEFVNGNYEIDLSTPTNGTCAPDYKKYHRQMAWKTGLALPRALVGGAATLYLAGDVSATLAEAETTVKWASVATTVISTPFLIGVTAANYVLVQTDAIVRLVRSATMMRVIDQAYATNQGAAPGKDLLKFHERMTKKYPETQTATPEQTASIIVRFDQDRALCDGSLKKRQPRHHTKKLKRLLVTPPQARKAVAAELAKTAK